MNLLKMKQLNRLAWLIRSETLKHAKKTASDRRNNKTQNFEIIREEITIVIIIIFCVVEMAVNN